ncbi:MAG TPA: FecR family protein [Burkholderiaceae bacterium]|nr:FecR family protein [Burkholderiaceae bacterium]
MTEPDDLNPSTTPRDQALHWFTKSRLGALSPQEQRECEAWRAASPENEREYRSLESLWKIADQLPQDEMRAIMDRTQEDAPVFYRRRRFMIGAGAACSAALVARVVGNHLWQGTPEFTAQFLTARGERKQFNLPDGSLLDLNTATQVSVAFYEGRRVVALEVGEALFSVSPDASRPFTVDAGRAEVLVTGTQFNVRRDQDAVTVAVQEGTVEFSAGPWWRRETTRLTAGYVSGTSADQALVAPYQDNVAALIAWQRGRLVFTNQPLSEVVSELNRYLARPLRLNDGRVGQIRISGTVGIEVPETVLDVLPEIAPVVVLRREDGSATLAALR